MKADFTNYKSLMNKSMKEIFKYLSLSLENDKEIISHKLLGAGSGGSFLLITRKNVAINHYKNVIKVDNYEK